jgi:cob(I)alamin adenosyltransferase
MAAKTKRTPFQGYIQVYTGDGKGKTTAALGLALRAAGRGLKTYIGQFLKGRASGEILAIRNFAPHIKIERFGRTGFINVTGDPDVEDVRRARKGLFRCRTAMLSGDFDIVVCDEINVALDFKLLSEADVLAFLDEKPKKIELILTGRHAPAAVLRRADLVTEMKEVKHYSKKGVSARRGIEL